MNSASRASTPAHPDARSTIEQDVGVRIRSLRRQRQMSLDGLAELTGLTKSYLSKVERGLAVPSITTALKVSQAFGHTVGQLLGETVEQSSVTVIRKHARKPLHSRETMGEYQLEAIASERMLKGMEPFIMRPGREYQGETRSTHAGEEFVFVLTGRIMFEFVDRTVELEAGDALYFDSHNPHRVRSIDPTPAEAIVVVLTK